MKKFNGEADFVSPVGLVVAVCILIITLTIGSFAYSYGLEAGRYDAAHDSWNVGYLDAAEDCLKLLNPEPRPYE